MYKVLIILDKPAGLCKNEDGFWRCGAIHRHNQRHWLQKCIDVLNMRQHIAAA